MKEFSCICHSPLSRLTITPITTTMGSTSTSATSNITTMLLLLLTANVTATTAVFSTISTITITPPAATIVTTISTITITPVLIPGPLLVLLLLLLLLLFKKCLGLHSNRTLQSSGDAGLNYSVSSSPTVLSQGADNALVGTESTCAHNPNPC